MDELNELKKEIQRLDDALKSFAESLEKLSAALEKGLGNGET
ncbi:hypothetical protein [Candidatus Korobacter versatilis]|nr:hypothetical protein [Candidatus Koribacter versatilis]